MMIFLVQGGPNLADKEGMTKIITILGFLGIFSSPSAMAEGQVRIEPGSSGFGVVNAGTIYQPVKTDVSVVCYATWGYTGRNAGQSQGDAPMSWDTNLDPFSLDKEIDGFKPVAKGPISESERSFLMVRAYKVCELELEKRAELMCEKYPEKVGVVTFSVDLATSLPDNNRMKFAQRYSCEDKVAKFQHHQHVH